MVAVLTRDVSVHLSDVQQLLHGQQVVELQLVGINDRAQVSVRLFLAPLGRRPVRRGGICLWPVLRPHAGLRPQRDALVGQAPDDHRPSTTCVVLHQAACPIVVDRELGHLVRERLLSTLLAGERGALSSPGVQHLRHRPVASVAPARVDTDRVELDLLGPMEDAKLLHLVGVELGTQPCEHRVEVLHVEPAAVEDEEALLHGERVLPTEPVEPHSLRPADLVAPPGHLLKVEPVREHERVLLAGRLEARQRRPSVRRMVAPPEEREPIGRVPAPHRLLRREHLLVEQVPRPVR